MTDPHELAQLIKDTLNDRLQNGSQEHLAFETATLRGFMFSALDSLEHIRGHIERREYHNAAAVQEALTHLIIRLQNNLANLEDVRIELAAQQHNDS